LSRLPCAVFLIALPISNGSDNMGKERALKAPC